MHLPLINPKLYLMKSSMHEEKWFLVSNIEILKTSQELHFGVIKKDTSLLSHIHVFKLG